MFNIAYYIGSMMETVIKGFLRAFAISVSIIIILIILLVVTWDGNEKLDEGSNEQTQQIH